MDVLLISKVVVLGYIIISPFLSYSKVTFMNETYIKILLLCAIVGISFIDLQLAILCMIAFLVLLINLYKLDLLTLKTKVSQETSFIKQAFTMQENPILPETVFQETKIEKFTDEDVKETIYEFPQPYCPGNQYGPDFISEKALSITTDNRVKPYEEFVRKLSPEDSLKIIQSNEL